MLYISQGMTQFSWHAQTAVELVEYIVESILSNYTFHGMFVKEIQYLRGNGYTMSIRSSLKDGLKIQVIGRIVTYLEQKGISRQAPGRIRR